MSERFAISDNRNASKNTRLGIVKDFAAYRFGRDELAHLSRYLFIIEQLIVHCRRLRRPLNIIDVGCGDACIPRIFNRSYRMKASELIARYVGLDLDPICIRRTKEAINEVLRPFVEFMIADITIDGLQSFSDNEFDVLISTETLEHIQPEFVPGVLREFNRVARIGYISTPNAAGGTGKLPADHIKEWECEELTAEMQAVGIRVSQRIGIFSNLAKVKKIVQRRSDMRDLFEFLQARMDSHLLSLCMGRLIGTDAQNILYVCEFSDD